MLHTFQEETWSGEFGKEYTDRNTFDIEQLNALYIKNYGVSRKQMNLEFIGYFNRDIKILEVGTNSGNQIALLQKMGFKNLYGIEINEHAVELARKRLQGINIIQGSAFDIPFKDDFFDIVFTAGVLIHISNDEVNKVISEMYRCSKNFIWGFEYFSNDAKEVSYRGNTNLLWKADFSGIFRKSFPNLKLLKETKYKYLDNDNIDAMYLLEK
jgi:pseudaminic acid biosynthesis-associated methylase